MMRRLRQLARRERGQALAIVLGLLAIGGLTIGVSLNYTATCLKGNQIVQESTKGLYAADAGIEDTLWRLKRALAPATQLSENISQMSVAIETDNRGTFTLYFGQLIYAQPPQVHVDWVDVYGNITDLGGGVYKYTITVTRMPWAGAQQIKIEEVGARIPVGYSYQTGSAASFPGNLSTGAPGITLDAQGAYVLKWDPGSPRPEVSENVSTRTQIFRITGTGSTEGHYACMEGQPESIGKVGQIKGTRYRITAIARRAADNKGTARIRADLMIKADGTISIISWKILR